MSLESDMADLRADLARIESKLDKLAQPVRPSSFNLGETEKVLACSGVYVRQLIRDGHLFAGTYPGMQELRVPQWAIDRFLESLDTTPTLEVAS